MKICYIDVETGGVDPKKHALLQIGGIIEIDGKEKERFNFKLYPFENDEVSEEALEKTGISIKDLEEGVEYRDPKIVYKEFCKILSKYVDKFNKKDKFFLVGYNSHSFDFQFMVEWFIKCGDPYFMSFFWYPSIDVMILAATMFMEDRSEFVNFKLETVYKEIVGEELDSSRLHDAMYDIEITKELYLTLLDILDANK